MRELFREFVEDIPGTYAYPYMARIIGEDPVYRFQRVFLRYKTRSPGLGGNWYTFFLPCNGVYELCTKRFDSRSRKFLSRDRNWFAYFDGEFYELGYTEVLFTLWNINAQIRNPSGQFVGVSA